MSKEATRKTIGKERAEEQIAQLNDERDQLVVAEALSDAPLNGRERAMNMEIVGLKRQLEQERARNAVLSMGGKGTKPIGDTYERMQAIEERVLATGDMTDEAKVRAVDELRIDMKKYKSQKEAFLGEVEANVSKRVEPSDKLKEQAGLIIKP